MVVSGCGSGALNIHKCFLQYRGLRALWTSQRALTSGPWRQFSSDSSSGDGDGKPKNKAENAKAKLNELLQNIMKDQEQRKTSTESSPDKEISFKLAKPLKEVVKPTPEEIQAAEYEKTKAREIGKKMLSAVKRVANEVEGDSKEVENELVAKLKSHSSSKTNFSELIEGMQIVKTAKPQQQQKQSFEDPGPADLSRAGRVRKDMGTQRQSHPERQGQGRQGQGRQGGRPQRDHFPDSSQYRPIDLFGAKPLGIFTKGKPVEATVPISYLKTWDFLQQKELKLAATHPPANGFEEMILWTEQGKLWKFPINNEQGLDIEAQVSFEEHVFLEPNIDPWCPKKGPIRHFMELVCIGLSKNPYLTVQEKKDHLEWYHLYFKDKAQIIKDVGAGEIK